ncbi:replication protein P [uncultured Pluralibacter sp.]|uniref:replication protein P n=1 Tax=uncultured Pluralibacter sp. TaxID=1490864 RepID=UPI00262B0A66|nr:replication protein P [uncultured Pluralibacter sp.]
MGRIYGQQWIAKNGSVPDKLWTAQIRHLTSEQLEKICSALVSRCAEGNFWPPSLAEFVALAAESGGGLLGLTTSDIIAEYRRWRNESYRYDCAEKFPWQHPVLYQICTEMRRKGIERQMTEAELERLAGRLLAKWEKHLKSGKPIPSGAKACFWADVSSGVAEEV